MADLVAAVDVGTGSARAGVFTSDGRLLGRSECAIALREPASDRAEQDSEDIWRAVCSAMRSARAEADADPARIAAIGFDATCSLVLRDRAGRQLAVSADGDDRWDTILWLDHRARTEAAECTATGHVALGALGGVMSPEMQIPKLMWVKRRLPSHWARAGFAFDLADFLAWRASGATARSACTLACKWTYMGPDGGWPGDFFAAVGLADLRARAGLPERATPVGADLGPLTAESARDLGLTTGARVAAGLIDAHAGALGVLGGLPDDALARTAALIAGTSNCLMTLRAAPFGARGLWGPCRDVVLPGLWMTEGGQSASGALLDHVCRLGGGAPSPEFHARIWSRIAELRAAEGWDLAGRLHVLSDFRGNRSPEADAGALGVISGLTLDASFDGLARLYWRSAVAVALGLRDVLEAMRAAGCAIDEIHATGGHVRNPALVELYAAATGASIHVHDAGDAVLLGAAMTAAAAGGLHAGLSGAARAMRGPERRVQPDPAGCARLNRDFRVMLEMRRQRARIDALSSAPNSEA